MDKEKLRDKSSRSFRTPNGWWSRGYLPHLDAANLMHFVTIRLADSLPQSVHATLDAEAARLKAASDNMQEFTQARQRKLEKLLDAGYGSCALKDARVARAVVGSLEFLAMQGHTIARWVIMPNHLHLLIAVHHGTALSSVIRSFKGFTAKTANEILGRSGTFWFPEFFDRYLRDAEHYSTVVRYIDQNPVRAGLVKDQADWRFSSAGWTPQHEAALPMERQRSDLTHGPRSFRFAG